MCATSQRSEKAIREDDGGGKEETFPPTSVLGQKGGRKIASDRARTYDNARNDCEMWGSLLLIVCAALHI